jgi:nucleoside-diphosphate kinase
MDTSEILAMITNAGFKIISLKLTQLTVADAQAFYSACCKTYGELVEFMSRGAIVAAILKKTTLLKILEH